MKTEKKPSEPSCVPTTVVKEEPDADPVKIKEEGTGGNNDDTTGEDTTECSRDPCLDPSNGEGALSGENQSNSANQPILNSVKQEGDHNNPTDDIPDCSGNVITADGIQPLVSNVLGKQMGTSTGSGEAQYMQQQSQIFVFSTTLANKGADAVMQGQYPSIIAYHCAQPGTKKYLEKHPNKVNQFRQNPAQWLNNLAMMKQKSHQGGTNNTFQNEQPPDLPALDPNAPPFWNEQPNLRNLNGGNTLGNSEPSLDDANIDVPCLVPNSPGNSANPQPPNSTTMGHSPNLLGGTTSPGPGSLQPSLQGVKVPDENLTPQQRQHREVQLATIRKMQMMLFPEHKEETANTLDTTQGTAVSTCPPTNVPSVVPTQCPPTMDWHKLQHQFLDGKNKASVGSPGTGVSLRGANMVGVPRSQGPPPPYHQTTRSASVPIAIQSPNPSSPNNPTSNLSLPSPRASSALNSPADCNRQFQIGNQRTNHLPGQSPTSQDSPNPTVGNATAVSTTRLNHSNPGTPVSHSHISTLSPSGTTAQKDSSLDFSTSQPPNAQQKQQHTGAVNAAGVKEANLMPVPSPQQIQYLNTFEGQELTIQKQPNTSLKDGNLSTNTASNTEIPNRILPGTLDNSNQFPARSEGASPVQMDSMNRGFTGSLHSPHTPHTPHTPGNGAPHTPVDPGKPGNKSSASAQSSPAPHNTNIPDSMGPPRTVPASPTTKPDTSPPSTKDTQQQQTQSQQQQQQQQPQQQSQQQPQQPPPQQQQQQSTNPSLTNPSNSGNATVVPSLGGPSASFPCGRPSVNVSQPSDNVPLNPNNIGGRLGSLTAMSTNHFDPITSLAQMSQQLTNTAASNSLGNEGPIHSGNTGMMQFGNPHSMHMMQMGGEMNGSCHMGGPTSEQAEVGAMCMGLAGPPTSYSPTTSHTGSPGVPSKMGHPIMGHGMMSSHSGNATGAYPGGDPHAPPPRLMTGHVTGPSPYNGANVQVKPSAPNTIQYLPARPNVGHTPRGPPSLDFLQRFTNPLSNLESKMGTPSVNLQYFPNGCVPNSMGPHTGMPSTMSGGLPGMGGSPRMDGQSMNTSVGVHPSMRPVGNMRPQPNLMRMQHMVGGGVFPGGSMDPDKVFPPDMVSQVPSQPNPGMYVSGSKGSPMGLGPPPDATQPLPPSMGGATSNFKNSPFVGSGPSMSDPNYAQQFHNFQQQLYATGTRGSGPPHPTLHPPPNSHSHQQFFMPK
ncbi:protein BCL9 homolog isoform X2 [Bombus terrestris]|uniref:Protein BCL9 homolog isoform X2 n=1 Tax=Bombus terrestris TaxID=30195 RepID=A0A9B2JPD7_BOMTE|nr:protein BCL9 homolog isoform X2 [Bombus terrestris]